MKTMIVILLTAAITNNYVLVKFLGICSFLKKSTKNPICYQQMG